jgi:uncharacterized membrane protein
MTAGERSARRHWKGGLFYYNPQDPELSIPKRNGRGVTLNFARREAWVVFGIILSLPVIILSLIALAGSHPETPPPKNPRR